MQLALYNTLSRSKEAFAPLDSANIRMYVCGPTVYSFAHIGNARPVIVFDTLYRLLKRLYPRVTYVRNITDVDDKIINAAQANKEPIDALTERTARAFHDDMTAIGAQAPTHEPRATQHIGPMIAMIEKLIANGHAYAADGHALFSVPSMPDYGKLSGRDRDDMIAGARVEVAPYKKDPADFVLWKPSAASQPGWDSPWGRGRPGWHIECSAMGESLLGETFDIHGGGQDLIFPHHENEIAQSVCAHGGAPLARYWMHNGFLSVNDEKMSKSTGNIITVRELLSEWPGEVIRFALLSAHYRGPLNWTTELLKQAQEAMNALYRPILDARNMGLEIPRLRMEPDDVDSEDFDTEDSQQVHGYFYRQLHNDLNTPAAISWLHQLADNANRAIRGADKHTLPEDALAFLIDAGEQLGLLQLDPEAWFHWKPLGQDSGEETEIETLIAARIAARKGKDFKEADRIRDALAARGIVLEDGAKGTTWRRQS